MEIYELKYFLEVAQVENIHRASAKGGVSPASLSKAISRLEDELKVKLFLREGRQIKLTLAGHELRVRAAEIVDLEQSARLSLSGGQSVLQARIAGPEALLSRFGLELSQRLTKRYPKVVIEFFDCSEARVLETLKMREVHLGLLTGEPPDTLVSKVIAEVNFVTVVGLGHPLYTLAKSKAKVAIEAVLKHGFVTPPDQLYGKVGPKQSRDGWRDDRFLRKFSHVSKSLKLIETLVSEGQALAYLPDYLASDLEKRSSVRVLNIEGCPYYCKQKVKLLALSPKEVGWINELF